MGFITNHSDKTWIGYAAFLVGPEESTRKVDNVYSEEMYSKIGGPKESKMLLNIWRMNNIRRLISHYWKERHKGPWKIYTIIKSPMEVLPGNEVDLPIDTRTITTDFEIMVFGLEWDNETLYPQIHLFTEEDIRDSAYEEFLLPNTN